MWSTKEHTYNVIIYILAFFAWSFLRVLLPHDNTLLDCTLGSAPTVSCIFIIIWMVSVRARIVHRKISRNIMLGCYLMLGLLICQLFKYDVLPKYTTLSRYCWYLYYIPLILVPLSAFYVSFYATRVEEEHLPIICKVLPVAAVLLIAGIMTNDFHQFAFYFPNGLSDYEHYTRGILYYITLVWCCGITIASLAFVLMESIYPLKKAKMWILLFPILATIIYPLGVLSGLDWRINGTKVFYFQQYFCLIEIALWECGIFMGVIPSNSNYEYLFQNAGFAGYILDEKHRIVYATSQCQSNEELLMDSRDHRVSEYRIRGGSFAYVTDLTAVNAVNQSLRDTNAQLAEENQLIQAEQEFRRNKIRTDMMNRLYDKIAGQVSNQVHQIEQLISKEGLTEEEFCQNLTTACVLEAYVKRRSNLTLITDGHDVIELGELYHAVMESFEYLKLKDVMAQTMQFREIEVPSYQVLALYDDFETVIEWTMQELYAVLATINGGNDCANIRLSMEGRFTTETIAKIDEWCNRSANRTLECEDDVYHIILSAGEGGAQL